MQSHKNKQSYNVTFNHDEEIYHLAPLDAGFCGYGHGSDLRVAATPTELSNLKSGYYVIKVKSADGKSDENGNYLYVQDNKPYYDAKGSENSFAGSTIGDDAHKYIFFVENTDGKLTFQAYGTKVHFPSISSASYSKQKPGNQDQFALYEIPLVEIHSIGRDRSRKDLI